MRCVAGAGTDAREAPAHPVGQHGNPVGQDGGAARCRVSRRRPRPTGRSRPEADARHRSLARPRSKRVLGRTSRSRRPRLGEQLALVASEVGRTSAFTRGSGVLSVDPRRGCIFQEHCRGVAPGSRPHVSVGASQTPRQRTEPYHLAGRRKTDQGQRSRSHARQAGRPSPGTRVVRRTTERERSRLARAPLAQAFLAARDHATLRTPGCRSFTSSRSPATSLLSSVIMGTRSADSTVTRGAAARCSSRIDRSEELA